MPNNVRNRLEIYCDDAETMKKIKMMIFTEDKDKKQIFSMSKMLPLPEIFSGPQEYSHFGIYWCRTIWGTKWDVYDCSISESGATIVMYYSTAWSPNDNYVELLCLFINKTLDFMYKLNNSKITVKLKYYDYPGNFGGILEWVPFTNPKSKTYQVMEYAKLYDDVLYDNLLKFEGKDITPNDESILPNEDVSYKSSCIK